MEIVLRATSLYLFIWILTRAMGRKELSQLSPFELVLLVTMGDLIQQGVTEEDMSVTGAVLAVGTMGLLVTLWSYLAFRFPRTRPVIEGVSVVVVRDGRPEQPVMRLERLTLDEIREAAREQGIADLSDVRLGILEADGRFSFLTAQGKQVADTERPADV